MPLLNEFSNDDLTAYLEKAGVESYYLPFLTKPQLCLILFLKSKNVLLSLLKKQLQIVDSISYAIKYLNNIEDTITTSMTDLKVALLQLEASQQTTALKDYQDKVKVFLSKLALKSGSSQEMAQTNIDSKEDIYTALQTFLLVDKDIQKLLSNLKSFNKQLGQVNLGSSVVKNISIESRNQITSLDLQKNEVSNVSIATNLLSSSSLLSYFTKVPSLIEGVYSPLVSNTLPASEEIYGYPESLAAVSLSNSYPQTVTHDEFKATIDGTSYTIPFPSLSAKSRVYLRASQSSTSFTIPTNSRLYLKITCPVLPNSRLLPEGPLCPIGTLAIDLPSGVQSFSTIASTITTALLAFDTGLVPVQFGFCSEFIVNGSKILMIYGKSDVTQLEIVTPPGEWNNTTGVYTPAYQSAHTALFLSYSKSEPLNTPSYTDLLAVVGTYLPISLVNDKLQITSNLTGSASSLAFISSISTDIGFTNAVPVTNTIVLKSRGQTLNPTILGLYSGCIYKDTLGNTAVITVLNNALTLSITVPNEQKIQLQIYPDCTFSVQSLLLVIQSIQNYAAKFTETLGPLINSPTLQQIEVAKLYLEQLKTTLTTLITNLTYSIKASPLKNIVDSLLTELEQKGLDKLAVSLTQCDLQGFFSGQVNSSSFGLQTMTSMELLNG